MRQKRANKLLSALAVVISEGNFNELCRVILGFKKYEEIINWENLTPRESNLICYHFGLDSGIAHSYEETGIFYGVTHKRIRDIEKKALRKIKEKIILKLTEEINEQPKS
jgi:DNA-directed RNA polymerase sigma subunit (sigma70/sigma32)